MHRACSHDKKNLHHSALLIHASITDVHKQQLLNLVDDPDEFGPILVCHLIKSQVTIDLNLQRSLMNKLMATSIANVQGEDVQMHVINLRNQCKSIL